MVNQQLIIFNFDIRIHRNFLKDDAGFLIDDEELLVFDTNFLKVDESFPIEDKDFLIVNEWIPNFYLNFLIAEAQLLTDH